MKIISQIEEARELLNEGKIIAYPTEGVYGLGCDPYNQAAVEKLLALKQRPASKGLIILIAEWSQLAPLINSVPDDRLEIVRSSWPGPVTWIFPKATTTPNWLTGQHPSVAVRMTAHAVARALCVDGPIISTSANLSGREPAMDMAGICSQFPYGIDGFLLGALGGLNQPSPIYDALDGTRWR